MCRGECWGLFGLCRGMSKGFEVEMAGMWGAGFGEMKEDHSILRWWIGGCRAIVEAVLAASFRRLRPRGGR